MPLVNLPELLDQARLGGYAVGYFEAWDSYSLEAVVEAAEAERAPVILGFGCMKVAPGWLDNTGIEVLGSIGRVIAERATVPTSLLLNEAQTYEQALRGIRAGFNAVMLDSSGWPLHEAKQQVAQLVAAAHAAGVAVEAELGRLPDAVGGHINAAAATLTDPAEADAFITATGADCLAVSIGNVHRLLDRPATVDLDRLAAIHRRVSVPLVMHGGTSFPADAVRPALASGVTKFNVGTILKKTFLDGLRAAVAGSIAAADVHALLGSHREMDLYEAGKIAMRSKVRELIRLYGGSGRASGAQ